MWFQTFPEAINLLIFEQYSSGSQLRLPRVNQSLKINRPVNTHDTQWTIKPRLNLQTDRFNSEKMLIY